MYAQYIAIKINFVDYIHFSQHGMKVFSIKTGPHNMPKKNYYHDTALFSEHTDHTTSQLKMIIKRRLICVPRYITWIPPTLT